MVVEMLRPLLLATANSEVQGCMLPELLSGRWGHELQQGVLFIVFDGAAKRKRRLSGCGFVVMDFAMELLAAVSVSWRAVPSTVAECHGLALEHVRREWPEVRNL
eukprot:6157539-Pyramimonas_sp.AAC.1